MRRRVFGGSVHSPVPKVALCFRELCVRYLAWLALSHSPHARRHPKDSPFAECERVLDSTLARVDTTIRFPSRLFLDSTVKRGEVEGQVVSALDDQPVASAQLFLHSPDSARHFFRFTDDEGRFHYSHRVPGRLVIEARRLGFKPDSVQIDSFAGTFVKVALRVQPLRINPSCCGPMRKGQICI